MKIIEIEALYNGAHNNQEIYGYNPHPFDPIVPEGWAIIPDDMVCENFPFGEITVDEAVPPVVTNWIPGEIPEPEPEPVPELTIDVRVTALEDAVADGLTMYEEDLGNG